MPFSPARCLRLAGVFTIASSLHYAAATELGEAMVRSHAGQNLIANIELTGMADAAVPVLVRLASSDVYRGANIAMPPVLRSLQLSVMLRDGRQFLHVISTSPVHADHLNLFLELNDGSRRDVRAVTLWLTPEPPAPAVPSAPVAAPLPRAAPVLPAAPAPALPPASASAASIAPPAPSKAPALARAIAAARPAACPAITQEELRTCAALDYKNGMLQARIVELEGKVKALLLAVEGRAGPPASAALSPARAAPKPPPPPKEKVARFPWLAVGAGVLVAGLIGWLALFLRRKKAQLKGAAASPSAGLLTRVAARFKRRKNAPEVNVATADGQ